MKEIDFWVVLPWPHGVVGCSKVGSRGGSLLLVCENRHKFLLLFFSQVCPIKVLRYLPECSERIQISKANFRCLPRNQPLHRLHLPLSTLYLFHLPLLFQRLFLDYRQIHPRFLDPTQLRDRVLPGRILKQGIDTPNSSKI